MEDKIFKIVIPNGGKIVDKADDNIDVFVVFQNLDVFVASFFTIENIKFYMNKDNECHFWASDLFIVKDLHLTTIRTAVSEVLNDQTFEKIFRKIGTTVEVLDEEPDNFGSIVDLTYGIFLK